MTQKHSEELQAQLEDLTKERNDLSAQLEALKAARKALRDPEAAMVDLATVRAMGREAGELEDLLEMVEPRIVAIKGAVKKARQAEAEAHALALRPRELELIRRVEQWLADGIEIFDECHALARDIRPAQPRCIPHAHLERLVRGLHTQVIRGHTVERQYTDWAGVQASARGGGAGASASMPLTGAGV